MNDVVVSRGATAGMVELRVEIDGEFVANLRADGLIVALADRLDRLRAVGRRADPAPGASPAGCWCRSRRTRCPTGRSCCPTRGEVAIEIVAGRDASVNFDMQSLASLLHGDRDPRAPLGAPGALPASARLELLRHAARASCTGHEGGPDMACCAASRCATS